MDLVDARGALTDRGSASLLAGALIAVVVMGSLVVFGAMGLVVAAAGAQAAADAAALAAVSPVVVDACDTARRVASMNGARVVACGADGSRATVVVTVEVAVPFLGPVVVERRADAERG